MVRRIDAKRPEGTPELGSAQPEARVPEQVNPAKPSRDEFFKGVLDQLAGGTRAPTQKATSRSNLVAALAAQQSGATLGKAVAPSAIEGFSLDAHVMPQRAADQGAEMFFGGLLPRVSQVFSDRLMRGRDVPSLANALMARVEAEGPMTLDSGVRLSIADAKPDASDYLPLKPPLLRIDRGGKSTFVGSDGLGMQAALLEGREVRGQLGYRDLERLGMADADPMLNLEMKYTLGRGASTTVAAEVARVVDEVYAGGTGRAQIDAVETEAAKMNAEALGKYFQATGTREAFAKAADHVGAHGPAEGLGDHDMSIRIAPKLKSGNRVVAKDEGPLLVFENHASGASTAVRLDALERGKLEIIAAYEGKAAGRLAFDEQDKPTDVSAAGFASTIALNAQFWVGQLLRS